MFKKKPTYQELEKQIEELKSKNKIKQSEGRFNMLLKASDDMITVHKPNGKYIYYNGPTCYAITPKDIVGKMPNDLFNEEVSNSLLNAFKKVEKTGKSETIEVLFEWLGEKKWFSEYIYPVKNIDGEVIEIVKVCRDIHQRKITEQQLIIAKEKAERNEKKLQYSNKEYQTLNNKLKKSNKKLSAAKNQIEKNEANLKTLINTIPDLIWQKSVDGKFMFINARVEELLGAKEKEIIGKTDYDFVDKELADLFKENDRIAMQNGFPTINEEFVVFDSDKHGELLETTKVPVLSEKKNIIGVLAIGRNITEKRKAAQEIETKNKALVENKKELNHKNDKLYQLNNALNMAQKLSHVGSWEWNIKTDKAEWSDEMYNIYGVTKDTFYPSNENVSQVILPEDLFKKKKGIDSLIVDKMFTPFEFRIKRPSGEIRTLFIMSLEKNSEETVFGVTKDITERKLIEEKNSIIKQEYQEIFDNATISIWNEDLTLIFEQLDEIKKLNIPDIKIHLQQNPNILVSLISKIRVINVNNATLKLFEAKSTEEFLQNIHNTFGKDANKVFVNLIESIWNHDKIFTSEVNYKTLKGNEFAALFSVPIPQTKAKQKTVPVSIQSIQSIKDAKLRLEKTERELNDAQKLAHVGSWLFDPSTGNVEWSEETFHIWGFDSKKAAPEFNEISSLIHKEDLALFNNVLEKAILHGTPYNIEHRICLTNGEQKIVRGICQPVLGENGNVVSLAGTSQDITKQKQEEIKTLKAKLRLEKTEKELNEAQKLAHIGSYVFNASTNKIEWSNETFNIWGFDSDNGAPGYDAFVKRIHNDDQEMFNSIVKKMLQLGKPSEFEYRICLPNGEQKTIRDICKPVIGNNGEVISLTGIFQDITSQEKLKEEKLKSKIRLEKIRDELNEAQKLAHVGSWIFNTLTQEPKWSEEIFHIWGFNPNMDIPDYETVAKRVHIHDIDLFNNSIEKASTLGTPFDIEFRVCLPNVAQKVIRSICKPVIGDTGEVLNLVGTNQDITAQKLFEEAQIKHQRLKAVGEMSSAIAHDFNNSMQQMMGNLEIVKIQNQLSDNALDRLNSIGTLISDISGRVSALQKFGDTKHDNNTTKLINFNTLIEESIKESRPLWKDNIEKEGLSLTVTTDFKEIPKIGCNSGELKSVLYNLIKNSVEAMPKGGELLIKTGVKPEGVFATFTDTGVGMDEETKLKVFQPFFSTKGFKLGRGIGLSGAYGVVKKYGGEILVKSSEINKGTTMEIIFPKSH
jgi:PAS domain S-box-containing protein